MKIYNLNLLPYWRGLQEVKSGDKILGIKLNFIFYACFRF